MIMYFFGIIKLPAISFQKNIHFSIAKSWQRAKSLGALLTCAVRPGPVDHTPDYQRPETVTDGWIRIKTEIKKLMSLLRYIFFTLTTSGANSSQRTNLYMTSREHWL